MKRFLVSYLIPSAILADWMKTPPEQRKGAEEKMKAEWNAWTERNKGLVGETGVGGKTKRVSSTGVADTKNDIMLYAFVEAETHEMAAEAFKDHPHLQIPQSSIEIMEVRPMTGM